MVVVVDPEAAVMARVCGDWFRNDDLLHSYDAGDKNVYCS